MKAFKGKQKTAKTMLKGYKRGGKVKKMMKGPSGPSPTTDPDESPSADASEMVMAKGGKAKKRMDKKPRAKKEKHASGGKVGGKKAPMMDAGSGGGKGRLEKSGMKTDVPVKKVMKKGGKC